MYMNPYLCRTEVLPPWGFFWLQHTDFNIDPCTYLPLYFCSFTNICSFETCLCRSKLIPGVKQPVAPGMKTVHVVGHPPLTTVQKSKLKDGGGETFRFVTFLDSISLVNELKCYLHISKSSRILQFCLVLCILFNCLCVNVS